MAKNMYGLREGQIISILDVPAEMYGLNCGCVCPTCNAPFEACSLQGRVQPYFRHNVKNKASGGGGSGCGCNAAVVNETALHRLAKEILLEEEKFFAPPIEVPLSDMYPSLPAYVSDKLPPKCEYQKATLLICTEVSIEKRISDFQPDAKVVTPKGTFLVEIAVTHFADYNKEEKAERYGLPMLEIDLSDYTEKAISREHLREIIVGNTALKSWVYHPSMAAARNWAKKYYDSFPDLQRYRKKQRQRQEEILRHFEQRRRKAEEKAEEDRKHKADLEAKKALEAELETQDRLRILNADYEQDEYPIYDRHDVRWMKCSVCKKILPGCKISKHQSLNKGICRPCRIGGLYEV